MKSARHNSHARNACVSCRQRKTKCDEAHPVCSSCAKKDRECKWTPDSDRRTARGRKCQDCAAWRVKCAELEARLAVAEGHPDRHPGLSSAEHSPRPLHTAHDSAARQSSTYPNAGEQRCLQEPLFPLHEEPFKGVHSETTALSNGIDASDWLSGTAATQFPDAVPYSALDALYDYPFATAAPSSFLDLALDACVGPESAAEHAQP